MDLEICSSLIGRLQLLFFGVGVHFEGTELPVWVRSCLLEYFMEGTKSLKCFMWQAEDGIQSQQIAEGLSRESWCLGRNAAQKKPHPNFQ